MRLYGKRHFVPHLARLLGCPVQRKQLIVLRAQCLYTAPWLSEWELVFRSYTGSWQSAWQIKKKYERQSEKWKQNKNVRVNVYLFCKLNCLILCNAYIPTNKDKRTYYWAEKNSSSKKSIQNYFASISIFHHSTDFPLADFQLSLSNTHWLR
jgi:hypothetical protein